MKKQSGAEPTGRTSLAGNPAQLLGLTSTFTQGFQTCPLSHVQVSLSDCGDWRNHSSSLLQPSGSNLGSPRGLEGYGPQRRRPPLKILGGGAAPVLTSEQGDTGEALSSSTSERTPKGPASFRTSPDLPLARVFAQAMEGENTSQLTDGQIFLYDLCQEDLLSSCNRPCSRQPTPLSSASSWPSCTILMLPSSLGAIGKMNRQLWHQLSFKASSELPLWTRKATLRCVEANWTTCWWPTHWWAPCIHLSAFWEVPWRPHCALEVKLDCAQPAQAQQLQRFPPIGRTFQLSHLWTSFQEDNGPFHIMDDLITGLGSDFARWATQTEKYITQMLHKPTLGRGSNISLYQAPLVDTTTSKKWLRGAVGKAQCPHQCGSPQASSKTFVTCSLMSNTTALRIFRWTFSVLCSLSGSRCHLKIPQSCVLRSWSKSIRRRSRHFSPQAWSSKNGWPKPIAQD